MAAAVLIAVGFGVVSWFQGAASKDGMSPAPDTASTGVGRAASGPAPAFVAAPPEVPARNQVQRVESRLKIGDDYYAIRTQEGLRWYERNGYPSRDTIQAAMSGWAGVADLNASDGISPWEMVLVTDHGIEWLTTPQVELAMFGGVNIAEFPLPFGEG